MPHTQVTGSAKVHGRSALARLQQFIAVSGLLLVVFWVVWSWDRPGWVVAAGALLLLAGYALVLGLEFFAVARVNRNDAAPPALAMSLLGAWWREVRVAPLVFSWRQPFRWRCLPDEAVPAAPGRTGVVFVHGFVCNRGFWLPWMRRLKAQGIPYASVNLEPVFGTIDGYIPLIDDAVRRAHALTGQAPVLVCHSMGGLAARAWRAATPDADSRVCHIVTIGTPHRGTWLGQFSHVANGRQMRLDSAWLQALQRREAEHRPLHTYASFTCWYSNADNIVFPASTATLPGADNRFIHGQPHVAMAFVDQVVEGTLSLPVLKASISP
jgi:triacylglycerol lipase